MTAPGCGMGDVLKDDVRRKVPSVPGVREVDVNVVWDPPWDAGRMSDAARLQLGWMRGPEPTGAAARTGAPRDRVLLPSTLGRT